MENCLVVKGWEKVSQEILNPSCLGRSSRSTKDIFLGRVVLGFFFFPFYEGLLLYSHKEVNEVLHRAKTIPT